MLCHEGVSYSDYLDFEKQIFESPSQEDIASLKFAHWCGFTFDTLPSFDDITVYNVNLLGKNYHFEVIGLNNFTQNRGIMSIVLESPFD